MGRAVRGDDFPDEFLDEIVFVSAGFDQGRIGISDGFEFLDTSFFTRDEMNLFLDVGVSPKLLGETTEPDVGPVETLGYWCDAVHFGQLLTTSGYSWVPHALLTKANTNQLVSRNFELREQIGVLCRLPEYQDDNDELKELLPELLLITQEMWNRERFAMGKKGNQETIFLCHSSKDKPLVKQVALDLSEHNFRPWLDEFEINVGDSIVDKINSAAEKADAIVVFLSSSSVDAPWVKKEWQASLMRQLAKNDIKILPALIDNCDIPPILADIKYADFRGSYLDAFEAIVRGIGSNKSI